MPTKLVRRSAMSVLPSSLFRAAQVAVDGVGGDLAVLDALHGEIGAAGDAIAAGPDVGERGLHLLVHRDLAVGEVQRFLRLAVDRVFHELLPDRLEHLVAQDREGLAGADQAPAVIERGALELHFLDRAILADQADRTCPVLDLDAVDLRELLLMPGGAHVLRRAAIDQGHVLGAQLLGLHSDIDGGVAAADDDHLAANLEVSLVGRLAQIGDVADGIGDARQLILALQTQRIDAGETEAQEHRIEVAAQLIERDVTAERLTCLHGDAADGEHEIDLGLGEVVDGLVGGDAVFVEATELVLGVEDRDVVAKRRQAMRARQAGGPAANHSDALAGWSGPHERIAPLLHQVVDGEALEHADIDRLVLRGVPHTLVFAQDLGRTDPRAHAAEDVGLENRLRRTLRVAGVDHADEVRDVDRGRTRLYARRIVAEIAAAALDQRFLAIERRLDVFEIGGDLVRPQTSGCD